MSCYSPLFASFVLPFSLASRMGAHNSFCQRYPVCSSANSLQNQEVFDVSYFDEKSQSFLDAKTDFSRFLDQVQYYFKDGRAK
jgi:hypothetical protein